MSCNCGPEHEGWWPRCADQNLLYEALVRVYSLERRTKRLLRTEDASWYKVTVQYCSLIPKYDLHSLKDITGHPELLFVFTITFSFLLE